jgi:hypothetical protein
MEMQLLSSFASQRAARAKRATDQTLPPERCVYAADTSQTVRLPRERGVPVFP